MNKKYKLMVILFFCCLLILIKEIWVAAFAKPEIKDVFFESGTLMVIVQHPPSTIKTLQEWWANKLQPLIEQLPDQQQHELASIFVVNYHGGYKTLARLKKEFSDEEDYICFDNVNIKKRCLLKEYPVFINVGSIYYSLHMGDVTINIKKQAADLKSFRTKTVNFIYPDLKSVP